MSTELQRAVVANNTAKAKSELSKGADPNQDYNSKDNNWYTTPLIIIAVEAKNLDMAKMLIDAGANTCKRDKSGQTPLHHAICTEDIPLIKLLLENGASFNLHDDFITAIEKQNLRIVQEFINFGADVNTPNRRSKFPVMCAICSGNSETLKLLSECGADLNMTDSSGNTPIIEATRVMNFKMVKFLIEKGADLNKKTINNETALSISLFNDDFRTFQLLIESGADSKLANGAIERNKKTHPYFATYMLKREKVNLKQSQTKRFDGHEAASN